MNAATPVAKCFELLPMTLLTVVFGARCMILNKWTEMQVWEGPWTVPMRLVFC